MSDPFETYIESQLRQHLGPLVRSAAPPPAAGRFAAAALGAGLGASYWSGIVSAFGSKAVAGVALAGLAAGGGGVAATVATGSPDPAVWTQKAQVVVASTASHVAPAAATPGAAASGAAHQQPAAHPGTAAAAAAARARDGKKGHGKGAAGGRPGSGAGVPGGAAAAGNGNQTNLPGGQKGAGEGGGRESGVAGFVRSHRHHQGEPFGLRFR